MAISWNEIRDRTLAFTEAGRIVFLFDLFEKRTTAWSLGEKKGKKKSTT